MSFNNSSGFSFKGKNTLNNVHGDQANTTITAEVVHMHGDNTEVTERTIFGQFEDVKRGHVIGMKDLGSVDLSQWDWYWQNGKRVWRRCKSARKTISTVQIHPDQQPSFTAIIYEGENAQEAWEDDFGQFSHASRTGSFKLFGINRSDIPMLIFHHELIPAAHFYTGSFWMNMYIYYLLRSKGCHEEHLWLNTSRGVLCKGPTGPRISTWVISSHEYVIQALPSTADMLEEGSSIAFFSKFGSIVDGSVLQCAWQFRKGRYRTSLFPKTTQDHQRKDNNHTQSTTDHYCLEDLWQNQSHHLPINIIGGLRFDTVYSPSLEPVARWPPEAPGLWEWDYVHGVVEETRVDGGLTRFKLDGQGKDVCLGLAFGWFTFQKGWLPQSSRVFDSLTGHQGNFFVVHPFGLRLQSTRREYNELLTFSDAVEETRLIYLFLYPLPRSISQFISWMGGQTHFWSFDEDGQSRIPEEEWERWGIPILTPDKDDGIYMSSWPTHICTALRKWQIARGFDPSTADLARVRGCPEFEIVGAKKDDRFEKTSGQPGKSGWNWLWSAVPGSDISAFAC